MMAQYPDVFIMTFSIHIPNFVLLSQTAQLLLIFAMPPHYKRAGATRPFFDKVIVLNGLILQLYLMGSFCCIKNEPIKYNYLVKECVKHSYLTRGTCTLVQK